MKVKFNLLVFSLIVLFITVISMNANLLSQDDTEEVTIEGMVIAIDWDEDDNVTAVAISVVMVPEDTTEEEYVEDYLVADNEKGKELLKLTDESVIATGKVEVDEFGTLIIYVREYKVIREEE